MISLAHINYCFIGCKDKQKTRNRQRFLWFSTCFDRKIPWISGFRTWISRDEFTEDGR